MKKWMIALVVVVVLGLVVAPTFAFGGFGGRGYMNSLSNEDFTKWLNDQVKGGWMTQKQADFMKQMHERRFTGTTVEEYNAWADKQVKDGWLTKQQADYMKENYRANQDRFGANAPTRMGQGMMGGCGMGGCGMSNAPQQGGMMGGRGMMGGGRGRW